MPALSACLIVKNEAAMLKRTLGSLKNQADEIIVVDTGSSDDTIAAAKEFGAKVYEFPWTNDFAAARNESLQHATGDWIIWIDADEFMPEEELRKLKEVINTTKASGITVTIYESQIGTCQLNNGYQRVKVFRNGVGVHFDRPVNEQVVAENGAALSGEKSGINIYHWGKDADEAKLKAKSEYYVTLLTKALEEKPNDPCFQYMLANRLAELNRLEEAIKHYQAAFALAPGQTVGRQAQEGLANSLLRLKRLPAAAPAAEVLLRSDQQNIPARNILASVHLVGGQLDEAIAILKEALRIKITDRVENIQQTRIMPNFLLSKAYQLKAEQTKGEGNKRGR